MGLRSVYESWFLLGTHVDSGMAAIVARFPHFHGLRALFPPDLEHKLPDKLT